MRYLLYISCLFICAACSSSYKKLQHAEGDVLCVRSFKPVITKALYNTQVNVIGKHLSGLLIIKTMPDSSIRMVFSNEAGFKFFDFGFRNKEFTVYYIFKQMDKKSVIKTLRKDFELVLMQHLDVPAPFISRQNEDFYHIFPDGRDFYYYVTDSSCSRLLRMERGSSKKRVVEAIVQMDNKGVPDTIGITHRNFNFDIGLKRLQENAEK